MNHSARHQFTTAAAASRLYRAPLCEAPPAVGAVLAELVRVHDATGDCRLSLPALCKASGYSRVTVMRAVAALEDLGVIRVTRTRGEHNHYWFPDLIDTTAGARPRRGPRGIGVGESV